MIDASKLTAPEYDSLTCGWVFPTSWSADDRETFEVIENERIFEEKRAADLAKSAEQAAESPALVLAKTRLARDAAKREREKAERKVAGEQAWAKALEAHGDRVRRLDGVEGDVFVMQAMTQQQVDAANRRAATLARHALNQKGGSEEGRASAADLAANNAQRDAMLDRMLHPDRARVKACADRYPLLWDEFAVMRNDMIDGRARDEGKGSAP